MQTFVEPPLRQLTEDFGNVDPNTCKVILVSAAGAVGKSTLAKEISSATGAVLVDLARTGAVGSNFLIGGLARCNLLDEAVSAKRVGSLFVLLRQ